MRSTLWTHPTLSSRRRIWVANLRIWARPNRIWARWRGWTQMTATMAGADAERAPRPRICQALEELERSCFWREPCWWHVDAPCAPRCV